MTEEYGSAGQAVSKSVRREKKKHKERTSQTGVRYSTLRAGQSLVVKLAEASVQKPGKKGKKYKTGSKFAS